MELRVQLRRDDILFMMNKITIIALTIGILGTMLFQQVTGLNTKSVFVSPKHIKCSIDSFTDSSSGVEVPVNIVAGAQGIESETSEYLGFRAMVVYNTGDKYEPQTFLNMSIEKDGTQVAHTAMHDYYPRIKTGPVNALHYEDGTKQLRL